MKKASKSNKSKKKSITKTFEKTIENEFKEIEKWMVERKRFLKKLIWVTLFIILLLLISNFYIKTIV
ncbi:hypothetical protein CMI42_04050 [Candidatus Pacearchaeota archaeon]|jgi:hypothetical protein|nr:hypothetical protein [Candidatus Pacearchaeota archaeon]|tara:strand:+ start:3089 stop:3289 length:201 start_codon:yes stop_codon:yes gene_type:complete